jgi:hypothetical protein
MTKYRGAKDTRRWLWLLVAAVLFAGFPNLVQGDLQVILRPVKEEWVLAEPVYVDVEVRNTGGDRVAVSADPLVSVY